jgi:hypothetical protein
MVPEEAKCACLAQQQVRTLERMRKTDLSRLQKPYPDSLSPEEPALLRLGDALGLDLAAPSLLYEAILADLNTHVRGIGWWENYQQVDRQTRILLSDYLVACAEAVPDNLIEAQVERLELDHAVEDFGKWIARGIAPGRPGKPVPPPRGAYEELSYRRVQTHLTGMVRAWGSALDCVGGCIVGVAGLPTNLVRTDRDDARKALVKEAPGNSVLAKLLADLDRAEDDAGPAGWRQWIVDMRNTVVHRGRRTIVWNANVGRAGLDGFTIQLPVSPALTDVDAVVHAGGYIASTYQAPAGDVLDRLSQTVNTYVNTVAALLVELWLARRADPSLLAQSPRQWKQPTGLINPVPTFRGFPDLAEATTPPTSLNVGSDAYLRLEAAGLTHPGNADAVPDPRVWTPN